MPVMFASRRTNTPTRKSVTAIVATATAVGIGLERSPSHAERTK
jgi:hypothetical protein